MSATLAYEGQFWSHPILRLRHRWARNLLVLFFVAMPGVVAYTSPWVLYAFAGVLIFYVLFVAGETHSTWTRLIEFGIARDMVASGLPPREILDSLSALLVQRSTTVGLVLWFGIIMAIGIAGSFKGSAFLYMILTAIPSSALVGVIGPVVTRFASRVALRRMTWKFAIVQYLLPPMAWLALLAFQCVTTVGGSLYLHDHNYPWGWVLIVSPLIAMGVTYLVVKSAPFVRIAAFATGDIISDEDLLNVFDRAGAQQ